MATTMTREQVLAALAVLGKRTAKNAEADAAQWGPMLKALRAAYYTIASGMAEPLPTLTSLSIRFGGARGGAVGNLIDTLGRLERAGTAGEVEKFLRQLGADRARP